MLHILFNFSVSNEFPQIFFYIFWKYRSMRLFWLLNIFWEPKIDQLMTCLTHWSDLCFSFNVKSKLMGFEQYKYFRWSKRYMQYADLNPCVHVQSLWWYLLCKSHVRGNNKSVDSSPQPKQTNKEVQYNWRISNKQ
jgi:hypothetical protein